MIKDIDSGCWDKFVLLLRHYSVGELGLNASVIMIRAARLLLLYQIRSKSQYGHVHYSNRRMHNVQ